MLTGKTIKAVSKGHKGILIRFNSRHGLTLEGQSHHQYNKPDSSTTVNDRAPTSWDGCYLGMYAMSYDSTWHFFQQSLKPTDEVTFVIRQNGSQFTKEAGMIVEELRAVIKRPSKNGKDKHFEMTLSSTTMGADNPNRIKEVRQYSLVS